MQEPVKDVRPYSSKRRQEAAEATRQVILEAARRLFERDGYVGTSMQAIATEAEVAVKTIYLAYDGKAALLREVWRNRLAPGEADIPVLERRWYRDVLDDSDPRQKLRLMVEHSVSVKSRSAALLEAIRGASSADTEVADLWTEIDTKLKQVAHDFVRELSAAGTLQPALTLQEAADALWALSHPTMWQLLVANQGWTIRQYARWLERSLVSELLTPADANRS
jgi:AcrR family transcriptional regulator